MEKQYCKVGAVTPITRGEQALSILRLRYESFVEKAARMSTINSRLGEFFNRKAQQLKGVLDSVG